VCVYQRLYLYTAFCRFEDLFSNFQRVNRRVRIQRHSSSRHARHVLLGRKVRSAQHGTAALLSQTAAPKAELKFQLKRACYGRGKEIQRHHIAHTLSMWLNQRSRGAYNILECKS
jgi:hypothetical protein